MAKAWGGAGAWAQDAEEAENEAKEKASVFRPSASIPEEAFPTLGEAASVKTKKKKEKQTLSLAEFTTGKYVGPGGRTRSSGNDLPADILMTLPKGPRARDESEEEAALGGGFRDYGGFRGGDRGDRGDRYGDRRGGFGHEDGARDDGEDMGPSRADEASDWGAGKKFVPSGDRARGGFGDRGFGDRGSGDRGYGDHGDREFRDEGPSRADEVDSWGSNKKFVPTADSGRRFDDMRRGGPEGPRADDVDNWGAAKKFAPGPPGRFDSGARYEAPDSDRWARREGPPVAGPPAGGRRRLVLAPRTKPLDGDPPGPAAEPAGVGDGVKSNPVGAPLSTKEVLQSKGRDWHQVDEELETKKRDGSTSSAASEGGSSRGVSPSPPVKAKPRVNPFGEAKPREVLLEQKGRDWKKMEFELEHRGVDRPESEEEKTLKEEIKALEEKLQSLGVGDKGEEGEGDRAEVPKGMNGIAAKGGAGEEERGNPSKLKEDLAQKEKELAKLTLELDDRVRYNPSSVRGVAADPRDRPGNSSGGGSGPGSPRDRGAWGGGRGFDREHDRGRAPVLEGRGSEGGRGW